MPKVLEKQRVTVDACPRCSGLMVPELTGDPGYPFTAGWRCVSCGEVMDPIIMANRQQSEARNEMQQVFVGAGSAQLN